VILNYFRPQKLHSSGVVNGLNNKAKNKPKKSGSREGNIMLIPAIFHHEAVDLLRYFWYKYFATRKVTNLSLPSRAVMRFHNKRGTAERWIKGKRAGGEDDPAELPSVPVE
jgi:hypothetical protein